MTGVCGGFLARHWHHVLHRREPTTHDSNMTCSLHLDHEANRTLSWDGPETRELIPKKKGSLAFCGRIPTAVLHLFSAQRLLRPDLPLAARPSTASSEEAWQHLSSSALPGRSLGISDLQNMLTANYERQSYLKHSLPATAGLCLHQPRSFHNLIAVQTRVSCIGCSSIIGAQKYARFASDGKARTANRSQASHTVTLGHELPSKIVLIRGSPKARVF